MSNESPAAASSTREDVEVFLRKQISQRTNVAAGQITPATVLVDIGLQSIDAVLICGEIETHFEIELDPAIMFEFRTLDEVTSAVCKVIGDS